MLMWTHPSVTGLITGVSILRNDHKNYLHLAEVPSQMHAVHIACNHVAEYQEPCDDCRALPQRDQHHKGCSQHNDRPLLHCKGDPTSHIIYLN